MKKTILILATNLVTFIATAQVKDLLYITKSELLTDSTLPKITRVEFDTEINPITNEGTLYIAFETRNANGKTLCLRVQDPSGKRIMTAGITNVNMSKGENAYIIENVIPYNTNDWNAYKIDLVIIGHDDNDNRQVFDNLTREVVFTHTPKTVHIRPTDPMVEKMVGTQFIDFILENGSAKGKRVALSDYVGRGKYTLVSYWGSWCGACKMELSDLNYLYEKYAGKNFQLIGVAVHDKPEDTKKAMEQYGVRWPQIYNMPLEKYSELYETTAVPLVILFSPEGRILGYNLRGDGMKKAVEEVLGN